MELWLVGRQAHPGEGQRGTASPTNIIAALLTHARLLFLASALHTDIILPIFTYGSTGL